MNQLKTILLLGGMSALLIAVGGAFGRGSLLLAVGVALVMNLGSYFFSDKLVLAMNRARELSPAEAPSLHRMVAELAVRAGIPKPRLFVTDEVQPNAFATGRNPSHGVVAVTRGLLELLDEEELRGVLAHEVSHIAHRDILVASVAAAMASAISMLANMVRWAAIFGGSRRDEEEGGGGVLGALAFSLLAPLGALLVQMAISRSREFLADEGAAKLTGDPRGLARALLKLQRGAQSLDFGGEAATASLYIVNPFSGLGGIRELFSTHPSTQARIDRLMAMTPHRYS